MRRNQNDVRPASQGRLHDEANEIDSLLQLANYYGSFVSSSAARFDGERHCYSALGQGLEIKYSWDDGKLLVSGHSSLLRCPPF